jgi:two-component system sensor histidine kinase TctE
MQATAESKAATAARTAASSRAPVLTRLRYLASGRDGSGKPSLKRLLAAWLLVPLLLLVPLAAAVQYWVTLRPALDSLDHGLGDAALALSNLLREGADGSVVFDLTPQTESSLRTDRHDAIFYAVLGPDGRRLAGDEALARISVARSDTPGSSPWQFVSAQLQGMRVRVAVHRQPCARGLCEVRVAETMRKRELAARDALLGAALSLVILAVLLIGLMFVAIRRGLAPLSQLRAELEQRSLDRLQPLDARDAPAEVQPLVEAINQMLGRMRSASEAQRAFIADAAHQLRTPLTSLRTEAELTLLEPHPPQLTPALTRLAQPSERAARLAGQLLSLARAEAPSAEPMAVLDLQQVARTAAAEWVPRAMAAGVDLGFDLQPALVEGRALLLQELLANLLHNALQYAGNGARVTVRTRAGRQEVLLEVEDNGPGIAAADRARVFERFDRGSRPRGSGSGLGLAIVRDIARGHGATVTLAEGGEDTRVSDADGIDRSADPGGLLVRIAFPPVSAAAPAEAD